MADLEDYMDFDGDFVDEDEGSCAPPSPYAPMARRNEGVVDPASVSASEPSAESHARPARTYTIEPREAAQIPGAVDHPMRSWSAIKAYMTCPQKAEYQYVKRIRTALGSGLVVGKIVHKTAVEYALKHKIATGALPELEDVLQRTRDEAGAREPEVDWSSEGKKKDEKRADFVEKTVALARAFHTEIAPVLKVVAVEEPFLIGFDGVVIKGFLDIVEVIDDQVVIHDLKNVAFEPPGWGDPAHRAQLGFYGLVKSAETISPVRGVIDTLHYKHTKRDGRQVFHLPVYMDENELAAEGAVVRDALHHVIANVAEGRFPRNPAACIQYHKPCEFMEMCFPERYRALKRAEEEA